MMGATKWAETRVQTASLVRAYWCRTIGGMLWMLSLLCSLVSPALAQETVCARVKIEIKQELTLERQGFDAEMTITNTLPSDSLQNVEIVVKVTDELGSAVAVTTDPNDLTAKFFVRVTGMQGISDIAGNGTVAANSAATIGWLLIPAPGAAGGTPLGKRYFIGATLKYQFGADNEVLDVSPALVTVRPMPLLTLDYFLTKDVIGDDPLTPAVEPVEPYTLGVRVKNNGFGIARNLKIDSAQPKIVDNVQGLVIDFKIIGSYVNDAPVANALLINFGNIPASSSTMGRWLMTSSLAGRFVDFTASFSHADELGGVLTSLMQAANAHILIRDVRVDLPGRDLVRDFLALDGDFIRVYESDGTDTVVTDRSSVTTLTAVTNADGAAHYRLAMPPTAGFVYVKLPDPFRGAKDLKTMQRSDAKTLSPENAWLSKTQNHDTKQWDYWINIFDANTTGVYDSAFVPRADGPQAPVLQFIPDRTVEEGKQISFIVDASSPMGKAVTLSAAPLAAGAKFTDQRNGRAVFDWTPSVGQAGSYPITYSVSDGTLSANQVAVITVTAATAPAGPATPTIDSPLAGAEITSLRPALTVVTGTDPKDPTVAVQFELYADAAMTQQLQTATMAKGGSKTTWTLATDLKDNTGYWWRARAYDGKTVYSAWVNGRFFVNLFNDAPEPFNLTLPVPNATVVSATPTLSLTNTTDKDGDAITYGFAVYDDTALAHVVASASGLSPGDNGLTNWLVPVPLTNLATYYWRATATDSHGAATQTPARAFTVRIGNAPPNAPVVLSPAPNARVPTPSVALVVTNASDAEHDALTYTFDIDTVPTFDSGNRRISGPIAEGSGTTSWTVTGLVENARYFWRVKANDGHADGPWATGNFMEDALNEAPPAPTVMNPGDKSWVSSLQPSFSVNPVVDPEGDTVRYRFEIYKDQALTQKVADGSSDTPSWMPAAPLVDKSSYYWRVRAEDALGAVGAWSQVAALVVSSGSYVAPSIAVTSPATISDGRAKNVTIRWEGTDPNIDATIALYYDQTGNGYAGALIVDGLKQAAGTQSGSYVWDSSALAPGAYHIYAVIYDAKGLGRAYAPGAVVVPTAAQKGSLIVVSPATLNVLEDALNATFTVGLSAQPKADVTIGITSSSPNVAYVSVPSLTFTSSNWSVAQTVTVKGLMNCITSTSPNAAGNSSFVITIDQAQSLDPDYEGIAGKLLPGSNQEAATSQVRIFGGSADMAGVSLCGYKTVTETQSAGAWDYTLSAKLHNGNATPLGGTTAKMLYVPVGMQSVSVPLLHFGAAAAGETVRSLDTFALRTSTRLGLGVYPTFTIKTTNPIWHITSP